jgi:hypothetical protein
MDVFDRMGSQGHPEEDYLERYVMKTCSEQELVAIEEHLLICEQCRARLSCAEEWVLLMKSALPLSPPPKRVPRWHLSIGQLFTRPIAMAAGCAALAAILLATPLLLRERPVQEELVPLSASRGGANQGDPAADSHRFLRLRLDVTDLAEPLQGQVVDDAGGIVLSQAISLSNPDLKLDQRLKPGTYWVRVNSGAGDHSTLREYSLRVR